MTEVERPLLFVYVIAAIAVALVGARYLQAKAPETTATAHETSFIEAATAATGDQQIVVHVAGAVNRPGVVALPQGSRAGDAIRRAGGFSRNGDRGGLNLAAKLADGQQVVVPSAGQVGAADASSAATGAKVSLNSATAEQLGSLDGIGPGLAAKIIAARSERGGFGSIDELADVPGIGDKRLESLRSQLQP